MLVIGTGGLASDILSSIEFDNTGEELVFYNDTEIEDKSYISQNFEVLRNEASAEQYFSKRDKRFIVAIGDNLIRKKISEKFEKLGGENINYVSKRALVSKFVNLGNKGIVILHHAAVGNGCSIGEGSLIYTNSSLGHGSFIGNYVVISGNVCMSDTCIGDFTSVSIGASFKPGVTIGRNCFVSIGAVVTKNIDDNTNAIGNPARGISQSK